jgi:ribosome-binding factor A
MTVKQERMQDRVRDILSSLLLFEVTDPALKNITVTDVTMDRELEHARVYVNALGDESRQKDVMEGLKRAGGFLRRELGKRLHLRRVPVLHFTWDTSLARGEAMEATLNHLRTDPGPTADAPTSPTDTSKVTSADADHTAD